MNWFSVLEDCFQLNSLPKIKGPFFGYYIIVRPFKFHYWSSNNHTEEVKIEIMHSDGDSLTVFHALRGGTGPPPDWACQKSGSWNKALNEAYDTIKVANIKAAKELEHAKAVYLQIEREKELTRLQKFEGMFK
jgi:hypothetical protein